MSILADFLVHQGVVRITYVGRRPILQRAPLIQQQNPVAQALYLTDVVAYDENGFAAVSNDVFNPIEALALEREIAYREHFVDDENIRVHAGGERKP